MVWVDEAIVLLLSYWDDIFVENALNVSSNVFVCFCYSPLFHSTLQLDGLHWTQVESTTPRR